MLVNFITMAKIHDGMLKTNAAKRGAFICSWGAKQASIRGIFGNYIFFLLRRLFPIHAAAVHHINLVENAALDACVGQKIKTDKWNQSNKKGNARNNKTTRLFVLSPSAYHRQDTREHEVTSICSTIYPPWWLIVTEMRGFDHVHLGYVICICHKAAKSRTTVYIADGFAAARLVIFTIIVILNKLITVQTRLNHWFHQSESIETR